MSKATRNHEKAGVSVEQARERFMKEKRGTLRQSTLDTYKFGIRKFVEWMGIEGYELADLSAWEVGDYPIWLRENHDFAEGTLESYTKAPRQFLKFCETKGLVPDGTMEGLEMITASKQARQWDTLIEIDRAAAIVEHMQEEYGSARDTVILTLLFRTGMRCGELHSLDVDDVKYSEDTGATIHLNHRPDTDTPLKRGTSHERVINIKQGTFGLLNRHVENRRYDVEDDYGRRPLITSPQGRLSTTSIQRVSYKWTSPPHTGVGECSCEDRLNGDRASKCEMSVSPHAWRGAHVTDLKNKGWTWEQISGRVGAEPKTLKAHYEKATEKEKAQRRRGLVDAL